MQRRTSGLLSVSDFSVGRALTPTGLALVSFPFDAPAGMTHSYWLAAAFPVLPVFGSLAMLRGRPNRDEERFAG